MELDTQRAESASATSKRFQCVKCSRCYSKQEHLNRHERTHTNSKPYRCHECGRRFGRQDVLSRHAKLHSQKPSESLPGLQAVHTPSPTQTNQTAPGERPAIAAQPGAVPTPPDEIAPHATFEDSDGLLNWLISGLNESTAPPLPLTDIPGINSALHLGGSGFFDEPETTGVGTPEAMGVQQLFKLIDETAKRLGADIDNNSITSQFLDSCLHEFFERVHPAFPVIHAPTFSSQKTIAPLLLNMVALGSLFVCVPNSVQKGELLWRLGHTAVATSWRTLITWRGPYDTCDGVQLVLTALLGQTYALLSSNPDIRTTAFVFHGLGFYWARTCGMYSVEMSPIDGRNAHATENDNEQQWERWAAAEVQRRAVLGHYILDGLISQASGSPASARHVINRVGTACSDAAFGALTANAWMDEMLRSKQDPVPMSDVYTAVLSPQYTQSPLDLSSFSVAVVIEGLQSLVAESHEVAGDCPGVVTRAQIIRGLLNIYRIHVSFALTSEKRVIRWHNVCMEIAAPSTPLYSALCATFDVPFLLSGISASSGVHKIDLEHWVSTPDSVRAFLHAMAIARLVRHLPFADSNWPHIPVAIFASAMVLGSICLFGTTTLEMPRSPRWDDVWVEQPMVSTNDMSRSSCDGQTAHAFLISLNARSGGNVVSINLASELNFLQLALRTVTTRWGISQQMERVIQHLIVMVHERQGPAVYNNNRYNQ
ncbi:hypothetical protein BJY01DRAFT_38280 [Aspergillus pseudoustus]|uniref:C2H2-type domain-containing protein n=1 Tax=Aspergillus pseudoustus TaxID=1810923 RepID=A0ABR4JDJ4_9EURO